MHTPYYLDVCVFSDETDEVEILLYLLISLSFGSKEAAL